MTQIERVTLLDTALRSGRPEAYLDGVQSTFDAAGRDDDALVTAVLRTLIRSGEIETVMRMRAEWMGGGSTALSNPDLGL